MLLLKNVIVFSASIFAPLATFDPGIVFPNNDNFIKIPLSRKTQFANELEELLHERLKSVAACHYNGLIKDSIRNLALTL